MKKLAVVAFVLGLVGVVGFAGAADEKAGPTGAWKWKTKFGEKEFEQSMKIEVKDGKVTGTVSGLKNDVKIEDGTFKDGELKFTVVRERGEAKITSKYSGKVDGDKIKGTINTDFGGKDIKTEWNAERVKEEKKKD